MGRIVVEYCIKVGVDRLVLQVYNIVRNTSTVTADIIVERRPHELNKVCRVAEVEFHKHLQPLSRFKLDVSALILDLNDEVDRGRAS